MNTQYDELAFFNHQLSQMLKEGIPLEQGIKRLCLGMRKGRWRSEFEMLEADLAAGKPLPEAIQERQLPEFYQTLIKVGVAANDLPGMLILLADYYQKTNTLWLRLKGIMTYPLIAFGCAFILSLWLLMLLKGTFPFFGDDLMQLNRIFSNFRQMSSYSPLSALFTPGQWEAYVQLSLWMPTLCLGFVLSLLGLPILFPSFRRYLQWRIPPFREAKIAQLALSMKMLVSGGSALPEALDIIGNLEKGTAVGDELMRWKKHCADGRGKWEDLTANTRHLPSLFVWLVTSAGEDLESGLQRAGEIYSARSNYQTELMLYTAMPASLLFIAILIIGQVFPFFVFLFSLPNVLSIF